MSIINYNVYIYIYYCELCTIIILWVCLKIGYPEFLWMIFPYQNYNWRPPGQSDAQPSLSQSQSCCTASQPRNAGENHTLCCGALKPIANLLTIIYSIIQYNTIVVMLHYCGLYVCPCMRLIVSLSANGHSSRIKKYFYDSFAKPAFIFRMGLMLKSFAKSFAKTNNYFRKLRKKNVAGSQVGTLVAFVMDNLYMDL